MVLFPPGEVLPWDFFRGEGLPYGIIPPWGSSAMGFHPGEGLPYGIPSSWGMFAMWFAKLSKQISSVQIDMSSDFVVWSRYINITDKCMKTLESTQGGIMKQVCGLS